MMMMLLALLACDSKAPSEDTANSAEPTDLRASFPEPPEGGLQLATPDYLIPAFSERAFCWFLSYTGEDVGISHQGTYQSDNGHHVVLMKTFADEDDFPDDSVIDCTDRSTLPMTEMEPLIFGRGIDDGDGTSTIDLPEGMAASLRAGTRLVVQSHYVNPTPDEILVRDAINLGLMPADEVQTWAAPFAHTAIDFSIAAGERGTVRFDCTWNQDATVLFLGGHMHERGAAFSLHWTHGEITEALYTIDPWLPEFRDGPPVNEYPGGMSVAEGDVFTTSCTFDNTTDHDLEFPEEMCVTFGFAYESRVPLICAPA